MEKNNPINAGHLLVPRTKGWAPELAARLHPFLKEPRRSRFAQQLLANPMATVVRLHVVAMDDTTNQD